MRVFLWFALLLVSLPASGGQQYDKLSDRIRTSLRDALHDKAPLFYDAFIGEQWLKEMSKRLQKILPRQSILQDADARLDFLKSLHYEARRANLDPQLILSMVHVESAFRKDAVSATGARGYMQVMPFWVKLIGDGQDEGILFNTDLNLRFGTIILQHYLELEKENLFRALGRYNGSLGRSHYPNAVHAKRRKYWTWP